ncbi:MAG: hypothetical protein J6A08_06210 [Lachnospiraceae bacterium]|nr:hypothetical protein [Lachnospiraceae bacterium]
MAILTKEYTDIKKKTHRVEHVILADDNRNSKEQIVEELFRALTRPIRHIPA